MAKVPVRDVGQIGLITDRPAHELPPNAWSRIENVVFRNNAAQKAKGSVEGLFGTPTVTPYSIFYAPATDEAIWVYCGLDKVYAFNGAHNNITRASGDYSGGVSDFWNGGWMNGILFLNNGVDVPQVWNTSLIGNPLVDMPGWDETHRAKVIRTFRNFVFALDVSKGSVRYPTLVKWSHPADPGAAPPSWDITDPSYLAGEFPLSETPGEIIDALPMRDALAIYKKDSIFLAQYLGNNNVFGFPCKDRNVGIPAQGCVKEFRTGAHIFLTQDADICVFDGQQVVSITTDRIRNQIHAKIAETNIENSFVAINRRQKEAWICFPTGSATWPNYAIVWNWETGTFGDTSFPECSDIALGAYTPQTAPQTWDELEESWDDRSGTWDGGAAYNTEGRMVGAFPTLGDIRLMSEGYADGTAPTVSLLERTGLAIVGQAQDGTPRVDPDRVKLVTRLWPLISSQGGEFVFQVGAQDTFNGPITWDEPMSFNPDTDEYIEPFIEGKYIAIRMTCTGDYPWTFNGYDLEVKTVGRGF